MAKILHIEDDPDNQFIYRAILEQEGHQVETISDGVEAIERLKSPIDHDLIFLDIMLPKSHGVEVLRFLRRDAPLENRSKRVIILTNLENPDIKHEAEVLGIERYMIKANIDPRELLDVVSGSE